VIKDKNGLSVSGSMVRFQRDSLIFQQYSMGEVANFLTSQRELGRRVVDKTGVTGSYSFTLHWSPKQPGAVASDGVEPPSIFTALQEDVGLRLQPSKGDVDILVIDHVEQPTGN
jgi:uncharacterized protein (TIGR03435 family)